MKRLAVYVVLVISFSLLLGLAGSYLRVDDPGMPVALGPLDEKQTYLGSWNWRRKVDTFEVFDSKRVQGRRVRQYRSRSAARKAFEAFQMSRDVDDYFPINKGPLFQLNNPLRVDFGLPDNTVVWARGGYGFRYVLRYCGGSAIDDFGSDISGYEYFVEELKELIKPGGKAGCT
jgi:hypothetical protein